jgi:hypothetical protein
LDIDIYYVIVYNYYYSGVKVWINAPNVEAQQGLLTIFFSKQSGLVIGEMTMMKK